MRKITLFCPPIISLTPNTISCLMGIYCSTVLTSVAVDCIGPFPPFLHSPICTTLSWSALSGSAVMLYDLLFPVLITHPVCCSVPVFPRLRECSCGGVYEGHVLMWIWQSLIESPAKQAAFTSWIVIREVIFLICTIAHECSILADLYVSLLFFSVNAAIWKEKIMDLLGCWETILVGCF